MMNKKLTLMPEKKGESSKRTKSGGSLMNDNVRFVIDNIIQTKLLKHQEEALEWLLQRENAVESPAFWTRSEALRGGILNDAPTLGKKLTLLSLVACDKKDSVETKTTLVVCVNSATKHWLTQVRLHTVKGKMKVLDTNTEDFSFGNDFPDDFPEKVKRYDLVLIRNHALAHAMRDSTALKKVIWWRVILDRAYAIEDMDDETNKAMVTLSAKRKWAVTGKPIQNGAYNLLSLLSFLGFEISSLQRQNLSELMASISLRRTKDDVHGLPKMNFKICYVDFFPEECEEHDDVKKEAQSLLQQPNSDEVLKNLMMRLYRICTEVSLLYSDSDSDFEDISVNPELQQMLEASDDHTCGICLSQPKDTLVTSCRHIFCRHCILSSLKNSRICPSCRRCIVKSDMFSAGDSPPKRGSSSKVSKVIELLMKSRYECPATKTVIFSQFPGVISSLKEHLEAIGLKTMSLSSSSDEDIDQQFEVEDGPVIMLALVYVFWDQVNLGYVNLGAASRIIMMEAWLSPVDEERIINLVHRIGQTKFVNVVRLIGYDSIEEKILELQSKKRGIIRETFDLVGNFFTIEDIRFILGD